MTMNIKHRPADGVTHLTTLLATFHVCSDQLEEDINTLLELLCHPQYSIISL